MLPERLQFDGKRAQLNPLTVIEPTGSINAVVDDEWVTIDVAIDSGASETVLDEKTLSGIIDITEGPALRRGISYEVANGVEIPNLGERKFLAFTAKGGHRGVIAQICSVSKTPMSVS